MDERGEKDKEEHHSSDTRGHRRKADVDAAAEGAVSNHGESMDHQRDGGYGVAEEETAVGVLKEVEVVGGSEEASAPLLAHPCSLLQLLLRACGGGCLAGLLHGYCSDDDGPKPDADDDAAPEAAAAGGDEAATEVWAVRRPTPPGRRPKEGPGGNGGKIH